MNYNKYNIYLRGVCARAHEQFTVINYDHINYIYYYFNYKTLIVIRSSRHTCTRSRRSREESGAVDSHFSSSLCAAIQCALRELPVKKKKKSPLVKKKILSLQTSMYITYIRHRTYI